MKKLTYSEKLKHPKWQKKRLEILNLAKWRCEMCGADDKTLHVHHMKYRGYIDPWKYSNEELIVCCESHHWILHVVFASDPSVEACKYATKRNRSNEEFLP